MRADLERLAKDHWSGKVRDAARIALAPVPHDAGTKAEHAEPQSEEELDATGFECFHQCFINHGNASCAGADIRDGRYALAGGPRFYVRWTRAGRNAIPAGFPIKIEEDSRPDYGTNTFLRVDGGWLYGTDRWHYDGAVGFVGDDGSQQKIGVWGDDAVAIIDTPHFGKVLMGQSLFGAGNAGLLARLEQSTDRQWKVTPVVALPSPPWAWATTPDGTLLVADSLNAVAVHRDGRIENLTCPADMTDDNARTPDTLLQVSKVSPRAPRLRRAETAAKQLPSYLEAVKKLRMPQKSGEKDVAPAVLIQVLSELGSAYSSLGRNSESLRAYQEAENLDRTDAAFREYIIAELYATNRMREADDIVGVMLGAAPTAAGINSAVFWLVARGKYAQAVTAINEVKTDHLGVEGGAYLLASALIAAQAEDADVNAIAARIGYAAERENLVWPEPLVEMLRGNLTERELVAHVLASPTVPDHERLCEALYFRGMQLLVKGDRQLAQLYFHAASETGIVDFLEYQGARIVLDRAD